VFYLYCYLTPKSLHIGITEVLQRRPLLGNGLLIQVSVGTIMHTTLDELVGAVFSIWYDLRLQ
jgi:hypothetical protein